MTPLEVSATLEASEKRARKESRFSAQRAENDSEYFRDLIRRDQEQSTKLEALNDAIQEGLASGISNRTVGEIWAEAEARYKGGNA